MTGYKEYEVSSLKDTEDVARMLAKTSAPGDVIALIGPMGAGKTAFSKAFSKYMGVSATVNSPTFTILNIYDDGRLPVYHFDCYRIEDAEEIYAMGFEEYLYGEGVCLIEWADIIKDILPIGTILVKILVLSETKRRICIGNITESD